METVFFEKSMLCGDFKKNNEAYYESHPDCLVYHSDLLKTEGSHVNKGDTILYLSCYPLKDLFPVNSPSEGYIHYDIHGIDKVLSEGGKAKICELYDSFIELADAVYSCSYAFSIDEFTGKEVFNWKRVAGKETDSFKFNKLYGISFDIIDNTPYLRFTDVEPGNLILLFDNKEKIELGLADYAKQMKLYTYVPLYRKEIELLSSSPLDKFRIYHNDGYSDVTFERWIDKILFHLFVKTFVAILDKKGIDWKSLYEPEKQRSDENEAECYVYLMHDTTNGFYKIGISNKPEYRERTLQSEKPTIELIQAKQYPSRDIAEAIEASLHKVFSLKRIRGEWFSLDEKDVDKILKTLQ